jgi:TatD DNase family protein
MIDTHAHIYGSAFEHILHETVEEAQRAGLVRVYLPNIDADSIEPMRRSKSLYPDFFGMMMGLHPCSVDDRADEALDVIREEWDARSSDYLAVGEIGLDLYWRKDNIELQMQVLDRQFDWAVEKTLPVSIHCREAFEPFFELVDHRKRLGKPLPKGVIHCFTGHREQAERCLSEGFHLGIGGVVTYPKAGLAEVLKGLPADRLLLETDSPYVSPVPFRGKPNRPAYLEHISMALSKALDMPISALREKTTAQSLALFEPHSPLLIPTPFDGSTQAH